LLHIDFHVEEPSAEAALQILLPRLISCQLTFRFLVYNGKNDLLRKLPSRLSAYHGISVEGPLRVVVLVDQDNDDCHKLKNRLEDASRKNGLSTKTTANTGSHFLVLNRVVIEELEAWFLGDHDALVKAYPRISRKALHKPALKNPDLIAGGTWEALQRLLMKAEYYRSGMPKIETARKVATFMNPKTNSSQSFRVFRDGLTALTR
jgi:hypothetical protein